MKRYLLPVSCAALAGFLIWLLPLALFGLPANVDSSNCLSFVKFPDSFPYAIPYFNITLFLAGLTAGIIWPSLFLIHPLSIYSGQLIYIVSRYLFHSWSSPTPGPNSIFGFKILLFAVGLMSILPFIGSLLGAFVGWAARKIFKSDSQGIEP